MRLKDAPGVMKTETGLTHPLIGPDTRAGKETSTGIYSPGETMSGTLQGDAWERESIKGLTRTELFCVYSAHVDRILDELPRHSRKD